MSDLNFFKPISALTEWEDNYNTGDVDAIARSIRRFGFNGALRIWGNTVLAGNHTLKALKLIKQQGADPARDAHGQFPPSNIRVEGDEWFVPFVSMNHLDPLEAKAFAIADNQTARLAVVDERRLADFLSQIRDADQTMLLATGYHAEQVEALIASIRCDFDPQDMSEQARLDVVGQYCETCGKRLHSGKATD